MQFARRDAHRNVFTPAAPANQSGPGTGEPQPRPVATRAPLSPAERRRREDAVRFADAPIGLEGFKVGSAAHARAERFIAGEIDLAEFLRAP
jgi:hypothetical protein